MRTYKDKQNNLHVLDSDYFEYLLPSGCVQITDDEAQLIIDSKKAINVAIPSISPRQIRQALTAAGLREAVEAGVAAGSQDLKDWWEFSDSFERLHPEVIAFGVSLKKSDKELNDLWALGASL